MKDKGGGPKEEQYKRASYYSLTTGSVDAEVDKSALYPYTLYGLHNALMDCVFLVVMMHECSPGE